MEVKKVSVVEMLKKVKDKKEAEHVAMTLSVIVESINSDNYTALEHEVKSLCDYMNKNNVSGQYKKCKGKAIDQYDELESFIKTLGKRDIIKSIVDCIYKIKENKLNYENTKLIIMSLFIACTLYDIEFKDL